MRELRKGGITMRVSSVQTIEYLKLHLAYNGIKTGLLASCRLLEKIVSNAADQTAIFTVLLLNASLALVAMMRVGEAAALTAYCSDVCEKILPIIHLIQ
jgi:hypothetical protein